MAQKQVEKSHYKFSDYMIKGRWISIWHQIDEIIKCNPSRVLEIGPGNGILKETLSNNDILVETVDIDPELNPDIVASATKLPLLNNSYDVVCAFQVLEHMRYEDSLMALGELIRVSKRYIIISLPNAKKTWTYSLYIPKLGQKTFHLPSPPFKKIAHKFTGEHYWEINKKNYSLKKILDDFNTFKIKITKSYRVNELTYHHFFVFEKIEI